MAWEDLEEGIAEIFGEHDVCAVGDWRIIRNPDGATERLAKFAHYDNRREERELGELEAAFLADRFWAAIAQVPRIVASRRAKLRDETRRRRRENARRLAAERGPRVRAAAPLRKEPLPMRACLRCGTEFQPLRKHRKFCSGDCAMRYQDEQLREAATRSAMRTEWSRRCEVLKKCAKLPRMRSEKHDVLNRIPGLRVAALVAAENAGASIDELVHAAHSRPTSPAARLALGALKPEERKALADLPWPYECRLCNALVDRLVTCTGCGRAACNGCEIPGACKECRAEEKAKAEKAERLEAREAQREALARKAAKKSA